MELTFDVDEEEDRVLLYFDSYLSACCVCTLHFDSSILNAGEITH
jgi:hypothetical protein